MQPTRTQVQRSLDALERSPTELTASGHGYGGTPGFGAAAPQDRESGEPGETEAIADIPAGLVERLAGARQVRVDRIDEARLRLRAGDEPTADDVADRLVGRLVCDRLR